MGLRVVHGHVMFLLGLQQHVTSCHVNSLSDELPTGLARSHRLQGRPLGEQCYSPCKFCHVCPAAEHADLPAGLCQEPHAACGPWGSGAGHLSDAVPAS